MESLKRFLFKVVKVFVVSSVILLGGVWLMSNNEEANKRELEELSERVKTIPANNIADNLQSYRRLVQLDPANETYKNKVAHYKEQQSFNEWKANIENGKPLEVRAKAYKKLIAFFPDNEDYKNDGAAVIGAWENRQALLARRDKIEKTFSSYDGSHRRLEKLIISSMHNPDSYDHVETRYGDKGDHLIVVMKYRGTNGVGAVVTNTVSARVALEGRVLEILSD